MDKCGSSPRTRLERVDAQKCSESRNADYDSAMIPGLSRRLRVVAVAAIAVAALSACSPASENPEAAIVSTLSGPLGTVSSVAELQEAFTDAGGDCVGDLEELNKVTAALSSGVCPDSGTVLAFYLDSDSAKESVTTLIKLTERIGSKMILGDNWSINPSGGDSENAAEIAEQLGAQLLQTEATPVRSLDEAFTVEQAAQAYNEVDGTDCESPVDVSGDGSVLECADLTLIVTADSPMETETLRQMTADALDLDHGGIPVVGRRHIVVIYDDNIDPDNVARQIDGATPSA